MRRQRHEQAPLEQCLTDQPEVEFLQVAQSTVHELRRAARRAGGEVATLDERDAVPARRGVERDSGSGDAAADDDDVEALLGQSRQRRVARDHSRYVT